MASQSIDNSSDPSPPQPLYEIPFLVGVAGHRDLVPAQVPAIRAAVEALLRQLQSAHPDVRVQLICPMADGADLLVAEVAQSLDIDILALLTFPEDICRADLLSDEARVSFDRVMARAERLHLPLPPGVTRESLGTKGPERDRQYQRAALVLARYCTLVIAIWDGKPTAHAAGTARLLEYRRRGIRLTHDEHFAPTDVLLSASDNDLVYDIRCLRASDLPAADGALPAIDVRGFTGSALPLSQAGTGHALPEGLHALLSRTAEFNRDSRAATDAIHAGGRPLPEASGTSSEAMRLVEQLFVQADYLGGQFRRAFLRAIQFRYGMWACMATALFAFEKKAEGAAGLTIILAVLTLFLLGRAHAARAHRHSWHRKYLDYRALAEALRVDYFWETSGVRHRYAGEFAHESFLQKQDLELEWIRSAMRAVSLRVSLQANPPSDAGFVHAQAGWIGDDSPGGSQGQLHYYGARAGRLHQWLHRAEDINSVLLATGTLLAMTFLGDILLSLRGLEFLPHAMRHYLLWTMSLLTVYAGIFETYLAERSDRTLIRQYRYMHGLFMVADRELRLARHVDDKLEILRSLGHACLAEHAQWTLAQRDKTIQGLKW
jgi:hypothetical protein